MFLKKSDVNIMALATGFIVANIYYCQPLIVLMAKEFNVSPAVAGQTAYLTQAGYATGLIFLIPLGDMFERKKQIIFTTLLAVAALIMAAVAPTFLILEIACFVIGFSSVVPQLILPLAAHLSAPEQRGRVVGTVMSGLLVGILASRTISGFIGEMYGWRSMYWIATGICIAIIFLIYIRFPENRPNFKDGYKKLMGSMLTLIKTEPVLRESSVINFFVFMIFGSFWTNMVLLLAKTPYNFQSDQIGLFGLVGATGALTAPLIGRIGDKANPRIAVGYGLLILFVSQLLFYFFSTQLFVFIAGIILLEMGQQSVHVSNQTRVYALNPAARNRLNTVLMASSFIGAASGSAIGLGLWSFAGWSAVCIASAIMVLLAAVIYGFTYKKALLTK